MITVLQRFLSRHRRWFFGLLLCIVVVPFVFTIGAMPGIGSGHGGKKRLFFGVNLSSPEAVGELQRATALGLYLEGVEGAFLGTAMMARAAWDWVARCLQVPFPDAAHLENFVRTRPPFLDESGAFSGEHYGEFSQSLRRKSGREESFVAEVLADDWRIHLTAGALAGTDFSLPIEARLQTRQLLTEWTLLKATLRFETFKPAISFSEDDLRSFFTSHSQRYVEPERVQVDSIFFPDSGDVGGGADAFLCKIHGEKRPSMWKKFPSSQKNLVELSGLWNPTPRRNWGWVVRFRRR
ncbi:MAG: hypothetical protein LBS68_03285 [Puniceicoccales bacterium]|nr:hypothetical protein [Puniceicoccales bacterium]